MATTTEQDNKQLYSFLVLLCVNNRVLLLKEIHMLFEKMFESDNKIGKAKIESAFLLDAIDKEQIELKLSSKFGRKISAEVEINPALIGGVKIIVDDIVIDASILHSLNKLAMQIVN